MMDTAGLSAARFKSQYGEKPISHSVINSRNGKRKSVDRSKTPIP
jgi:hypothetical protein